MAEPEIQSEKVPVHLGLILDGNRRWARKEGLPQLEGHRQGYLHLKTIAKAAIDNGVKFVSAYVFSTENWNRSKEEVDYLMDLSLQVAGEEMEEIHKENIKVRYLGSEEGVRPEILKAARDAEAKTAGNTRGTLCLCFNYGGHTELVEGVKRLVTDGVAPEEVTKELIDSYLYHPDVPPVDLMIRTSGEQRISNFMLWRMAYAELLFVDKHWPEFLEEDLQAALKEYSRRQRRFGS